MRVEDNLIASKQASKQASISYLRILATVCVVWLHTCSTLTDNPELFQMSDLQSWFFSFGHHMMSWAVPVFFMITGSLLLNPQKSISYKQCLSKYCLRIVLALFVFGIPFAMMRLYMETRTISPIMILKAVGCVFTNGGLSHFWYLYSLIGIYLLLPVLKIFVDHTDRDTFSYILIALFIFVYCLPTLSDLIGAEIAFGVYLVHPVFIQFVYRVIKITPLSFSLYPLATLAFCLFFVICSFIASLVMSLIKPLRKYIL